MKVLRQVGSVQLSQGDHMAKGVFNLFDTETQEVSLWFDKTDKDALISFSDEDFLLEAKAYFQLALFTY